MPSSPHLRSWTDGGVGSQYSICNLGTDCNDCGYRPGRRLLYATHGARMDAGEDADHNISPLAASPSARRLLKGGSSSSSSGYSSSRSSSYSSSSYTASSSYSTTSRSSGGRSATYGSEQWGSSSPSQVTYSAARTTTYRGTGTYGGSSAYSVHGRTYYGGYDSYSYYRGSRSYYGGSSILVVNRHHYGAGRSPYAAGETYVAEDQDRYQIETAAFRVPDLMSSQWPLTLTIHNATQFKGPYSSSLVGSLSQESEAFLGFYHERRRSERCPLGDARGVHPTIVDRGHDRLLLL